MVLSKLLSVGAGRDLRRAQAMVAPINALEAEMEARSDAELRELTEVFRQRLEDGDEDLDDLLPEAFAAVREASRRILGKRHFDVQLVGGVALHWGHIAEMRTGEGKTLAATLPAYLNALTGEGVHIVTVNPTSPMARTTSSASTTCATTWRCPPTSWCNAATTTPSWTRSTRSWWTRHGLR